MLSDALRDQLLNYLDGNMAPADRARLEQQFETNSELNAAWQALREMQAAGRDWEDVAVPQWSRLAGVTARPGNTGIWPVSLGWLSLATSITAILLVLFRAEISVTEQGFSVAFHESGLNPTTLEQRLSDLSVAHESTLNQRMAALEKKSLEMNRQLLTAALSYSRDERRREMTALATNWSRARSSDLMLVDGIRDNQLDDRLALRQLYTRLPPIN